MKRIKPALDNPAALALALLCLVPLAIGSPAAQSDDDAVATALMAAPPALAANAMVIRLDDAGDYEVLREGDNDLVCWDRSDQPNMSFSVQCTSVGNLARIKQNRAWAMSGQSAEEIRAMQEAAEADGTRELSVYGSMYYTVAGADAGLCQPAHDHRRPVRHRRDARRPGRGGELHARRYLGHAGRDVLGPHHAAGPVGSSRGFRPHPRRSARRRPVARVRTGGGVRACARPDPQPRTEP